MRSDRAFFIIAHDTRRATRSLNVYRNIETKSGLVPQADECDIWRDYPILKAVHSADQFAVVSQILKGLLTRIHGNHRILDDLVSPTAPNRPTR